MLKLIMQFPLQGICLPHWVFVFVFIEMNDAY